MSERGANDFRERARVEADRYGPDPWIFVRELLQNARDAGACRVEINIDERDGHTRVRCRDDGEGMGYEHARRYLFSLYASSKEDRSNQVGRFGVGFWSILRFEPARILIRSCPRQASEGPAWQVALDGQLEHAERSPAPELGPGTEVILERPGFDPDDERRIFEAAHQNARFLCLRDEPDTPLPISINGRTVNAAFALSAPSSSFRRGHVRGVVGLGNAPRVELFSRGLRIRSAACLDDLLTNAGHTNHSRVRFPELPGGLAPQALLESEGLELLLSRSDARDTRTLRRLVKLGQDELRQLVEHQLAQIRPPGIGERLAGLVRRVAGESTWWRAVVGATTGAVLALVIGHLLWPSELSLELSRASFGLIDGPGEASAGVATSDRRRYTDLRRRYHGPQVSELAPEAAEPLALRYTPSSARPYFAAMIIEEVSGDAGTTATVLATRYASQVCTAECIDVHLPVIARRGAELPLPIPTGHRLDVESLVYEDDAGSERLGAIGEALLAGPKRVFLSSAGEAVLIVDWSFEGTLRYRTSPGPSVHSPRRGVIALPAELRAAAEALRDKAVTERVVAAVDLVRERVVYRIDRDTAQRHTAAIEAGQDFVSRTLEIGAGDCDVQNGLLVGVLHAAKVDARLAVGWVGQAGGVSQWLHAWVEYIDEQGRYRVADATGSIDGSPSIAGLPPAPPEVVIGSATVSAETGAESGPPPAAVSPLAIPPAEAQTEAATAETGEESRARALPPALRRVLLHPWLPYLALGSGLLGLILLGGSLSRRTARRFELDEGGDLSSLLQGALAQPAAFRHLPSLFQRRLIPLRGGSAISLDSARALASDGELYSGRERTELCEIARRRGVTLLDAETPEGQTVAASLGAVDLDRWGARLERAHEVAVLGVLASYLRAHGERWRCAAVEGLGGRVSTLDLRPLGAGRRLGDRLVLIDSDDPWLVEAERLRATQPSTAAFVLLDHLLDYLDLGNERRARLLAPLAAAAVRESASSPVDPLRGHDG